MRKLTAAATPFFNSCCCFPSRKGNKSVLGNEKRQGVEKEGGQTKRGEGEGDDRSRGIGCGLQVEWKKELCCIFQMWRKRKRQKRMPLLIAKSKVTNHRYWASESILFDNGEPSAAHAAEGRVANLARIAPLPIWLSPFTLPLHSPKMGLSLMDTSLKWISAIHTHSLKLCTKKKKNTHSLFVLILFIPHREQFYRLHSHLPV